jgi:hypothetical protein
MIARICSHRTVISVEFGYFLYRGFREDADWYPRRAVLVCHTCSHSVPLPTTWESIDTHFELNHYYQR